MSLDPGVARTDVLALDAACPITHDVSCEVCRAARGLIPASELAGPIRETQGFRLVQVSFGAGRWRPVPLTLDDATLAHHGIGLAGPGRNVTDLSDGELLALVGSLLQSAPIAASDQTRWQLERDLLSRAPWCVYAPPIDVDVCEEAPSYAGPQEARETALTLARRLDAALQASGVARPAWHRTNERGGLHGDLTFPRDLSHTLLLPALGRVIRQVCMTADIPLLSQQPPGRSQRTHAIYVDDTLFGRRVEGRGVLWRLAGSRKPGSAPKVAWDLTTDSQVFQKLIRPMSGEPLERAIQELEREAQETRNTPSGQSARALDAIPLNPEPLTNEDQEFIRANRDVQFVWDAPPPRREQGGRSKKDVRLCFVALDAGAEIPQLVRLLYSLPGGKAATERREPRYIEHTIRWVLEARARTEAGIPDNDDSVAPSYARAVRRSPPRRRIVAAFHRAQYPSLAREIGCCHRSSPLRGVLVDADGNETRRPRSCNRSLYCSRCAYCRAREFGEKLAAADGVSRYLVKRYRVIGENARDTLEKAWEASSRLIAPLRGLPAARMISLPVATLRHDNASQVDLTVVIGVTSNSGLDERHRRSVLSRLHAAANRAEAECLESISVRMDDVIELAMDRLSGGGAWTTDSDVLEAAIPFLRGRKVARANQTLEALFPPEEEPDEAEPGVQSAEDMSLDRYEINLGEAIRLPIWIVAPALQTALHLREQWERGFSPIPCVAVGANGEPVSFDTVEELLVSMRSEIDEEWPRQSVAAFLSRAGP